MRRRERIINFCVTNIFMLTTLRKYLIEHGRNLLFLQIIIEQRISRINAFLRHAREKKRVPTDVIFGVTWLAIRLTNGSRVIPG